MTSAVRVYLVEDHPAVRVGIRLLLSEAGMEVCGEASSIQQALEGIAAQPVDLVIVDLSLGGEDGLDLVRELTVPALVYSMFEDAAHVTRAFSAGARGYLTKRDAAEVLPDAIRTCLAGQRYTSPAAAQGLADAPEVLEQAEKLSLQEQRVLDLLGQGFTTQAIAARLDLSPRTVESYFSRLQVKLGLSGMKALRLHAVANRPSS